MLNEKFSQFVQSEFTSVAYQGSPSSKKFKWKDRVFGDDQLFTTVYDAYNKAVTERRIENLGLTYTSDSEEAKSICNIIRNIAKENKKAHARHETARREADVGGSLGDTLTVLNETPYGINVKDLEIFGHFRVAVLQTVREVYYCHVDDNGKEQLECLGIISDKPENRAILAETMAKRHPVDIATLYETTAKSLATSYNEMQALSESEIQDFVGRNGWDKLPSFKSLYHYDIESVLLALISNIKTSEIPTLPWALHYIELYQVTSTKQDGENKITWRSGFKFKTKQGIMLSAKNYYLWALSNTEYFAQIERPHIFGDIYKLYGEAETTGHVLSRIEDSPFLKATLNRMTVNQMKVWCAFWYCVANHLPTPCILQQDKGGNCKNGTVDVIAEGLAESWKCPQSDTFFKLENDQLSDKQDRYIVTTVGLSKRTILDYLFVFYDEIVPSKELWDKFKAKFGAKRATINVRPLYNDPYKVEDNPVPCYMTRNSYVPLYEKSSIWRRLVVLRTDSNNAYNYVLTEEDKAKMDDKQVRKDTYATILALGKRAYEEIKSKGGMLAINDIFPEIGALLGSSALDYETDMQYFYKALFAESDKDVIKMTTKDLVKRYLKMYPDQDEDNDKALEMRLSNFILGVDVHNQSKRERFKGSRPHVYTMHRNQQIDSLQEMEDAECA